MRVKRHATIKQPAQGTPSLVCPVTARLPLSIRVLAGCWDLWGVVSWDGCWRAVEASQKRWGEHGSSWLRIGVLVGAGSGALGFDYTKARLRSSLHSC